VPVAHACNPSYSGGRDQEDQALKPAWANSLQDPILKKNPSQKKGWWSGSRYRPWVQAPVLQTNKQNKQTKLFPKYIYMLMLLKSTKHSKIWSVRKRKYNNNQFMKTHYSVLGIVRKTLFFHHRDLKQSSRVGNQVN
jgi:hypothetical protein